MSRGGDTALTLLPSLRLCAHMDHISLASVDHSIMDENEACSLGGYRPFLLLDKTQCSFNGKC